MGCQLNLSNCRSPFGPKQDLPKLCVPQGCCCHRLPACQGLADYPLAPNRVPPSSACHWNSAATATWLLGFGRILFGAEQGLPVLCMPLERCRHRLPACQGLADYPLAPNRVSPSSACRRNAAAIASRLSRFGWSVCRMPPTNLAQHQGKMWGLCDEHGNCATVWGVGKISRGRTGTLAVLQHPRIPRALHHMPT